MAYNKKKIKVRRRNTFKLHGTKCYLCGTQLTFRCYRNNPALASRDHLIPRSHGGLTSPENLRPCCISCNVAKSDDPLPYPILSFILWRGNLWQQS